MKPLAILLVFVFSATAWGQSLTGQLPSTRPRYKATVDTLYYDMQGRHDADSGLYGFEGVRASVQTMTLTYMATPTLHFNVQARQMRNYAETMFGFETPDGIVSAVFQDETRGMGDTKVSATKTFLYGFDPIILNLQASIPTGSISEKNPQSPVPDDNYPYNMQLGSGTYDFEPSLMYVRTRGRNQFGALGMAVLRFGRNNFSYRRGNEYHSRLWYTFLADSFLMPGMWLNYRHVQRMNGQDSTYGRLDILRFYHSPRHFWDLTANISSRYEITKGITLNAMVGRPLWQESKNIENLQVYARWLAQLGIQGQF